VAYAGSVYASDHAGLIAGVGAGSWSAAVAIAMPLFGRLFDVHSYTAAFWIATVIPICGFAGWLVLSRESRTGLPATAVQISLVTLASSLIGLGILV
jgi:MFS transporter, ACS family, aldohexuronate transporter